MEIEEVDIAILKPHKINAELYDDAARPEEFKGLVDSIRDNGIMQPLVANASHVILSGHRRWKAALEVGLKTLPVTFVSPENEELAIVEYNRYRKKTISELMREADCIMRVEKEKASKRQFLGKTDDGSIGGDEAGRTATRVAKALGVGSRTTYSKLAKIWAASKLDPHIADQIRKIDSGEKSITAVFKTLNPRGKEDMGLDLQIFSTWFFPSRDPFLGISHPGAIPGQVVENIMYYYTNPGDFIYDPFGGGGSTVDAAKRMRRKALVTDIAPVREDIMKWDIANGFPAEAQGAQLIFCDPPYWNMLKKEYNELSTESCSNLSREEFTEFLFKLIKDGFETLAPGGHFALIINPQTSKLPDGVPFIDWPFEVRMLMDEAGFVPIQRIVERLPTSVWNASQVEYAKSAKQILQCHGDILIGMKVEE